MPTPNQKAIMRQLRALFERRDRMVAELAEHDARIAAEIRKLCDTQGLGFMRVEAARRLAFETETEAA